MPPPSSDADADADRPSYENPFQAPQSDGLEEPLETSPPVEAEPRLVTFGALFPRIYEMAWAAPGLFLFTAGVLGAEKAATYWGGMILITSLAKPPIEPAVLIPMVAVQTLLSTFLSVWLYCGLTKSWFEVCTGRETSAATLFGGARWMFRGYGVVFISATALVLGLVLCCVPGLFAGALTAAALPLVVVEGRSVVGALKRAYALARPSAAAIAGVYFCQFALSAAALVVLRLAAERTLQEDVAEALLSFPESVFTLLLMIMNVLIYCLAVGTPLAATATSEREDDERG